MPEKIFRACLTWSHKEVSQARNGDSLLQVKEEHMQTPHGQEGARNVQDWKEGWTGGGVQGGECLQWAVITWQTELSFKNHKSSYPKE